MITFCPRCGAQFREDFRGEWFETGIRCPECGVAVEGPPALLAPGGEPEVEYDLGDWEVAERSAATTALVGADIAYRWEPALVLVVPEVAEDEVDRLLEDLDDTGHDDLGGNLDGDFDGDFDGDGPDGGVQAQSAMADLFVAADRLQHDPEDSGIGADAVEAATTVRASLPPYGIERPVWRRIQALASTLVGDLEEAAGEEVVAADARAVRDFLRDLV